MYGLDEKFREDMVSVLKNRLGCELAGLVSHRNSVKEYGFKRVSVAMFTRRQPHTPVFESDLHELITNQRRWSVASKAPLPLGASSERGWRQNTPHT